MILKVPFKKLLDSGHVFREMIFKEETVIEKRYEEEQFLWNNGFTWNKGKELLLFSA